MAIFEGDDNDGFGKTVNEGQGLGLAGRSETLALEIHSVAGAWFGGGVGGKEPVC